MKIKSITKIQLNKPKQFYDVIDCTPYHNFIVQTNSNNIVSHNCSFEDEVNFSAMTSNVEKMKAKMLDIVSKVDARMKSRFLRGDYLPTINVIASSKNSDQSFLDTYIETKKKNESKTTLIVDEPQWIVDDRKVTGKWFNVAIGNKFLANELLPLDAPKILIDEYRAKGYTILEVPSGYYENFQDNIDGALTDIAGIATASSLKYISGVRWNEIKSSSYQNPFTKEIIEVGNAKEDTTQYQDYFDLTKVPSTLKNKPLFIHLDMSMSGDKTGISGVYIIGKSPKVEGESTSKEMFYQVAFSVSIKAPKGYEISFDKHRAFIRWLKQQGFKIKGISADTFQSAQIHQQLEADGFEFKIISVDRLDSETKTQLQYAYLKSTIYDRRLTVYKDCDFLTEEVLGLERLSDGHIEHPDAGRSGCFTGDTKVSLPDGRELTMLELVDEYNDGKQNYVYSFNNTTKKIEPKLIEKAWCTRKDAELVEVVLDNGEVLRCTPNHKFMLRDGSYCEAKNLKENDSLMPLYRKYPTEVVSMKNYRMYYEPIEDAWHYEHRQFAKDVLDEKYLVHHKNCDPHNNNPDNLIWCSKAEHQRIHAKLETGAHSPIAEAKRSKSLSNWHKNNKDTEAYKKRNKKLSEAIKALTPDDIRAEKELAKAEKRARWEAGKANAQKRRVEQADKIKAIETTYDVIWDDLSTADRNSYSVKYSRLCDPSIQENISNAISANHRAGKYENAKAAINKCNEESKKLKELIPKIDPEKFEQIFGFKYEDLPTNKKAPYTVKYRRIVGKDILNHRVISVRKLDYTEDVYDITVQDNHNFALSAGIFVHNSKDQIDAICGALWNASLHAEEYSYEYGESLSVLTEFNNNFDNFSNDLENSMLNLYSQNNPIKKEDMIDFGFGPAEELSLGVQDGLMLW